MSELLRNLPDYLAGHLLLSVSAIILGMAISIPLGVIATRSSKASTAILSIASIVQTIPSIALLALMVPLLGGMIGFWPAFIALTLYSVLPILRNTVIGIIELDSAILKAADAVGMTERQRLWRVELPLAAAVIIGGVRTAAVWVVGTATLSTPVGATSLGNYIFSGLQTRNWLSVLFGCFFAAALAIILDQIIRLIEISLRERRSRLGWSAFAALLVVVAGGLLPSFMQGSFSGNAITSSGSSATAAVIRRANGDLTGQNIVVGSKAFTEQFILSELLEKKLVEAGASVDTVSNMGSTILFDALSRGSVDIYVDYTGTIWATIMERETPIERTAMFIEVAHYLRNEYEILVLPPLGFENAYGFAMRRDRAAELGISSIADLREVAGELSIGGDAEFFARQEWIRARDLYQLGELATRSMDSTFMYNAVRDGEVEVISAYTTDGRIAAYDLLVLRDPKAALPPYDAILLLSPQAKANPNLVKLLASLSNTIDEHLMREGNRKVDLDGGTPAEAADYMLKQLEGAGQTP